MDCKTVLDYLFTSSEKPRRVVFATEKGFREFWEDALTKGLYMPNFPTVAETVSVFNNTRLHLADSSPEYRLQSCVVFRPVSANKYTRRINMFWGFYQNVHVVWSRQIAHIIIVTNQPADEV
jgi:hypothetical protein